MQKYLEGPIITADHLYEGLTPEQIEHFDDWMMEIKEVEINSYELIKILKEHFRAKSIMINDIKGAKDKKLSIGKDGWFIMKVKIKKYLPLIGFHK